MVDRIALPQSYLDMPRWWHGGRDWLDDLPAAVATQCQRWNLVIDGPVQHGSNALIVPVQRGDEPLMLRMFPPDRSTTDEVAALRFWDGRGTVQLIEADTSVAAMLLERVEPGRPASLLPVGESLRVVGKVMRRLAVAPPRDAPSTATIVAEQRARFAPTWYRLGKPFPLTLLHAAERAAAALMTPHRDLAVDGDLHPDQILQGTREPWLAVDLVLYRGDIEYDLARSLWMRIDDMATDAEVEAHFATIVDAAELDAERAWTWVLFRTVDYWLWGLAHGLTEDPPRCARVLSALKLDE